MTHRNYIVILIAFLILSCNIGYAKISMEQLNDIPWSKIISGTKPTTLAGYGITNAYTKSEIEALLAVGSGGIVNANLLDSLDSTKFARTDIAGQLAYDSARLGGELPAYYSITGAATTIRTANLTASRALISNASGKVDVSSITDVKLGYLTDVTGNIQAQFTNKLGITAKAADSDKLDNIDSTGFSLTSHNHTGTYIPVAGTASDSNKLGGQLPAYYSITGAATTIQSANLTTNRALISNASGKVDVSAITDTKLGYLTDVTGNIQNQINGKAATSHPHGNIESDGTSPDNSTTKYLRGDGLWQVPPDNDTIYVHPTTAGNIHVPTGGASGQVLKYGGTSGTAVWGTDNDTIYVHPTTPTTNLPVSATTVNDIISQLTITNGHVTNVATRTLPLSTTSISGLMSWFDKNKLDGIAANANNYTHPTFPATGNQWPETGPLSGVSVISLIGANNGHVTGISTRDLGTSATFDRVPGNSTTVGVLGHTGTTGIVNGYFYTYTGGNAPSNTGNELAYQGPFRATYLYEGGTRVLTTTGTAANSSQLGGILPGGYSLATHHHNATYLGINSTAYNSDRLGGFAATDYATKAELTAATEFQGYWQGDMPEIGTYLLRVKSPFAISNKTIRVKIHNLEGASDDTRFEFGKMAIADSGYTIFKIGDVDILHSDMGATVDFVNTTVEAGRVMYIQYQSSLSDLKDVWMCIQVL